jgi:hypothetical protein
MCSRRDRQNACAAADVEDALRARALQHPVQQRQTSSRGAVVPRSERQSRFDLDADVVLAQLLAIMGAMDDEAAHADGRQAGERIGDPVPLRQRIIFDLPRKGRAAGRRDDTFHDFMVGLIAKIRFDEPRLLSLGAWLVDFKGRGGAVARIEKFDQ